MVVFIVGLVFINRVFFVKFYDKYLFVLLVFEVEMLLVLFWEYVYKV